MRRYKGKRRTAGWLIILLLLVLCTTVSTGTVFAKEGNEKKVSGWLKGLRLQKVILSMILSRMFFITMLYMASFTYNLSISLDLTNPRFEYPISGDDTITADIDSENVVTISVYDPIDEYESVEYYLNIYVGLDSIDAIPWTELSYLDVENGIFSPQFSRYRITYHVILENDVDSFDAAVEVNCRDEMNEDEPIFMNILVTSPSEETYSIYTLRLSYNSFIYTEKYSSFQLLVYLLLIGIGLFAIGFFAALYISRRKTPGIEELSDLPIDERVVKIKICRWLNRVSNDFYRKEKRTMHIRLIFWLSILFDALFFAAAMAKNPPTWYTNDDFRMMTIVSGAYTGTPSPDIVFIRYPIGLLLPAIAMMIAVRIFKAHRSY